MQSQEHLVVDGKSIPSPTTSNIPEQSLCDERNICEVDKTKDDGTDPSCCGMEKSEGCVVSGKVGCCGTEKKDLCRLNEKSPCSNKATISDGECNFSADSCDIVKEDGCKSVKVSTCEVLDQKTNCGIVNKGACKKSETRFITEEDTCDGLNTPKGCCSNGKKVLPTEKSNQDECETPKTKTCSEKSCCTSDGLQLASLTTPNVTNRDSGNCGPVNDKGDGCCGSPCQPTEKEALTVIDLSKKLREHLDIEKGSGNMEHVVLDVHGLTCVGCETKLLKSLQNIAGVHNLRTSLVMSQAEFDLDQHAASVVEVVKSVEQATGFTCQRLSNQGQEIDVIVDGDAKAFVARKYPDGIIQMVALNKQTVKITYDAKIVGARTLVEKYFDSALKLANPRGSSEIENGRKHVRNTALITLLSAILTIPVLVLAWAPLPSRDVAYGSASLGLATIVQVAIAGPFYPSALKSLIFTHVIEMDLLIVLSTSAAYIFSIVSFVYQVIGRPLSTGEFFETSTLLVTLIMFGRLVSAFARQRAVQSVSIRSLQAETVLLCNSEGRDDQLIDARLLQYGDLFKVLSDSRIATDGMIIAGATEVDESMLTGESLPIEKVPGAFVKAGSVNRTGVIIVRLTHLPGDNTISAIAMMVDEAKFSKPKIQAAVDTVASYFVPVILILTLLTFVVWTVIGVFVRRQDGSSAVVNAITYAISVLIVSCPCAIGLAVPMVVVIAGGMAAKHGVIFKSAMAIETARKVCHIVFDKTGTLTRGEMSVVAETYLSGRVDFAASVALGLTCDSKHPVSAAVFGYLKGKGITPAKISDSKLIVGKGIEGTLNGSSVRCGNSRWLSADTRPQIRNLLDQGLTVLCVEANDQVLAAFGLSDSLRPDSYSVVTELQKRGIAISIVSGDDVKAVEAVGNQLGIISSNLRSRCTPRDKEEYLKALMTDEKKIVMFCGDGTNDAVAIARAHIGVHMNSGSDMAQTAADVVLTRPCLSGILVLINLSHAAFRRVFFNFAWSFVYNLFAILLASGAFVNARISPQYAGLGEIVSVLPVILIALQLKRFRRDY